VISGQQTSAIPPAIDPAALERVRQLRDVDTLAADSYDFALVDGKAKPVAAYDDLGAANKVLKLDAKEGHILSVAANEIVMDDKTASDNKWHLGSEVTIQLQRTPAKKYTVAGIWARTNIGDGIIIPWADAQAGFRSDQPIQAFVKVRPGASVSEVQKQVDDILADSPEVTVQTRSAFVGNATQIFDFILGAVQVLLAIAMVIAVLGIINTLVLSVIERTRELGLLRAIGLRRSQTWRMITVESVVISVFGALLGLVVGAVLGAAVVRALRDQGFTDIALPWTLMVVYLVAAAVVGVFAALVPAVRAARLNVLNAIAYE
jgi:putative ABC transport system permease protein